MTSRSRALKAKVARAGRGGFTLIELVVVILILSIAAVLITVRSGSLSYWQQETFLTKLLDTIEYLHHQAIQDGEHYSLEINFKDNFYRVGALKAESEELSTFSKLDPAAGALSLELAAILNPVLGSSYTMIPPPSYPSLFEPVIPPEGVAFVDLRTMRGLVTAQQSERGDVVFSPRGFSEFAVLHLEINGAPITILVNPFNGLTELYREYKDFQWSYKASEE